LLLFFTVFRVKRRFKKETGKLGEFDPDRLLLLLLLSAKLEAVCIPPKGSSSKYIGVTAACMYRTGKGLTKTFAKKFIS
jgi:hypothetical protein